MRGLNPDRVPSLVANDVQLVATEASVLVKLEEERIVIVHNPSGRLSIMAVVGPGALDGQKFDRAILCEIGLGGTGRRRGSRRGRPYRRSFVNDEGRHIGQRRKWFSLSEEQYLKLSPHLFKLMQEITDESASKWTAGTPTNPFILRTQRHHYSVKKRKHVSSVVNRRHVSGVHFSVSPKDELLLNDFRWAHQTHDKVRKQMYGFAIAVSDSLSPYSNGFSKDFKSLNGVKEVAKVIERSLLPHHLQLEALRIFLPGGRNNQFWPYLCRMVNWDGISIPSEVKAVNSILPEPHKRVGNIHVLERKQNHNYVMFEMYPSPHI